MNGSAGLMVDWSEEFVRGDHLVVSRAVKEYGFSDSAGYTMVTLSENATYFIEDPAVGRAGILRVHRQNYHTADAIESELDWLSALAEGPVPVNRVLPTADGRRVVTVVVRGIPRYAVLFDVMPGVHPDEKALHPADFETLGRVTAQLHEHAKNWRRPRSFNRFSWDLETILGERARWGRWQDGFGVGDREGRVLEKAADLVRMRLNAYGSGPDRFGLIHADLRLANLLVEEENVHVIDFDDCGFSWFMYDFGTAVSFIEDDPRLPIWRDAWVSGYESVSLLDSADKGILITMVMLRRLHLVAWMGSHSHSEECQRLGPRYTSDTVRLARNFLASGGTDLS